MSSLLITNGHLVTFDEANRFIVNGSVYIENKQIVEVGEASTIKRQADRVIDSVFTRGFKRRRNRKSSYRYD